MEKPLPNILEYAEYRKYLREHYEALKARDKKFSHRYINHKTGVKSSGWFADLLAGRQRLQSRQIPALVSVFRLGQRERDFLQVLVQMEQAHSPDELATAYSKWFDLKGMRQETVAKDRFKYFERWYYPALRELLSLEPFQGDYSALAGKLQPAISPGQAKQALRVLRRLGLLLTTASDPLPVLVKDSSVKSSHWNHILKAYMKLSLSALDRAGKEERDISALTLNFSPEGLKKAGEEISALRKKLLMLSYKDRKKNRVYQCLFQVFPLSTPLEVKNGQG